MMNQSPRVLNSQLERDKSWRRKCKTTCLELSASCYSQSLATLLWKILQQITYIRSNYLNSQFSIHSLDL